MRFPFFRNRDSVKNGILISIRRTGDGFHPGLFTGFLEICHRIYELADSDDYIRDMKINSELNYLLTLLMNDEYYGAAEPPVRCGESHLSGLTEPPHFIY